MTVDQYPSDALQDTALEAIAQGLHSLGTFLHVFAGEFKGLSKADNVWDVFCPSPSPFLLVPTDHKGRDFCPSPNVEHAYPFGGMELVARKR